MSSCEHINDLRTRFWEDHEVKTLLDLWSNSKVQQELDGTKRNSRVFAWLSDELCRHGILRTASQVRDKLKCLKREYRISSDRMKQCGVHDRFKCKYFDELDDIMSGRKTSTSILPEISISETIKPNGIKKEVISEEETNIEESCENNEENETIPTVTEEKQQDQQTPMETANKFPKMKRSNFHLEKTLNKFITYQRHLDERFVKLEEKRLLQERELVEMRLRSDKEACERHHRMELELRERQWNHERQLVSLLVDAVTKRVAPTGGDRTNENSTQTEEAALGS